MILESGRMTSLIILIFAWAAILYSMREAKTKKVPIRTLPPLEHISEAVGRASEMGRPVFFCPLNALVVSAEVGQTISGMSVLQHVSRLCAKLGVPLYATVGRAEALSLLEEAVETGYVLENKEEDYKPENIQFLSGAYRAGTMDLIHQTKPAASILMGAAYGETLLIAESGAKVGALQIGGSARVANLSFLVALCDYCLIGEELYAAGAYLSQDSNLLGSIRGQDYLKIVGLVLLVIGFVLFNLGWPIIKTLLKM
jgi:hypothetical protein